MVVCATSNTGLVAVTVTPGTTAALSSTTCPWMIPVEPAPPWAKAGPAARARPSSRNHSVRVFTVLLLLEVVSDAEAHDARIEEGDELVEAGTRGNAEVGGHVRVEGVEDVHHRGDLAEARQLEPLFRTEIENVHVGRTV